jgi:hypothetical protein
MADYSVVIVTRARVLRYQVPATELYYHQHTIYRYYTYRYRYR